MCAPKGCPAKVTLEGPPAMHCCCWCFIKSSVLFVASHMWKGRLRCAPKHMHSGVLVCLARAASEANRPSCPGKASAVTLAVTAAVPLAARVWISCARGQASGHMGRAGAGISCCSWYTCRTPELEFLSLAMAVGRASCPCQGGGADSGVPWVAHRDSKVISCTAGSLVHRWPVGPRRAGTLPCAGQRQTG